MAHHLHIKILLIFCVGGRNPAPAKNMEPHCLFIFTGVSSFRWVSERWCLGWVSQPSTVSYRPPPPTVDGRNPANDHSTVNTNDNGFQWFQSGVKWILSIHSRGPSLGRSRTDHLQSSPGTHILFASGRPGCEPRRWLQPPPAIPLLQVLVTQLSCSLAPFSPFFWRGWLPH